MTKEEDFKLLKIQTCSLKVNIHCEGCNQKVKKLLQKIEGVYQVKIEAAHQKVTVSGSVDSATLINKLLKAGKHAELWSPPNQQPPQNPNKTNEANKNAGHKGQKQGSAKNGVEAVKLKKGGTFVTEKEEEEENEDVQLPKQQAVINSKKNGGVTSTNAKNGNGVNVLKKANQKQTQNSRATAAARTRNAGVESNEIGALMDLAGFNAAGGNGIPQVQAPPLSNINGVTNHNINSGNGAGGGMMMNLNGYNNNHPMNMQNRQMMHQPHQQMIYQRSAFIPASSGYHYSYTNPNPYTYYPYYPYPTSTTAHELQQSCHSSATTYVACDEDTSNNSSCNIM